MKKMIALLLCLLGSSSLWAQENTVLGTGALAQAGAPKYAIQEINITNPGSYNRPTIDFGVHQITWDYFDMGVTYYGVEVQGVFKSATDLGSFVPAVVGGHGSGATVYTYFSHIDDDGKYVYELYSDHYGSGYVPDVSLSPMISNTITLYTMIDQNGKLIIYYFDHDNKNLYTVAPTVNISFGGAAAVAVLYEEPVNLEATAIGYQSLYHNTSGRLNTAVGHQALYNSNGDSNIALGYLAGNTLTTGSNNLFIGNNAGKGITTGSGNLIVGGGQGTLNATLNNSVLMADGTGNPRFLIRDNGYMKVGYGYDFNATDFRLDVNGAIRGTTAMQTPRIYVKDVGFTHPQSSFYMDFLFSTTNVNTLELRSIVNPNNFSTVFSVDKPTVSVTFSNPVKGPNAVNNNEFVTLGQLSEGQTIGASISGTAAIANFSYGLSNDFINDQNLTNSSIVGPGRLRAMNGANVIGAPNNEYWNIISTRHSNPTNDYRMEIAGAFFENDIKFRNTNNNPAQGWHTFFHSGNIGYVKTALGLPTTGSFNLQGITDLGSTTNRNLAISNAAPYLELKAAAWSGPSYVQAGVELSSVGVGDYLSFLNPAGKGFNFKRGAVNDMVINPDGNVGIGITTPQEKLAVNGKIRAREVKVEPTNNWPDYVFEESYQPMSLAEIATFVKQHKHLPEVPSAKEVAQNGLELGEMNKVLLKKIEELTLHLIEKDQQLTAEKQVNKQQGEEIATLQQQYQALKKLIEKAIK